MGWLRIIGEVVGGRERSDRRAGCHQGPRLLPFGQAGQVQQELLLVMPPDDLQAHRQPVDQSRPGWRPPGCRSGWPGWVRAPLLPRARSKPYSLIRSIVAHRGGHGPGGGEGGVRDWWRQKTKSVCSNRVGHLLVDGDAEHARCVPAVWRSKWWVDEVEAELDLGGEVVVARRGSGRRGSPARPTTLDITHSRPPRGRSTTTSTRLEAWRRR